MIFPPVTLKFWLEKYSGLSIIEGICDNCKSAMPTVLPFIEKDYIGLISEECGCGESRNKAMIMLPTSHVEIRFWERF